MILILYIVIYMYRKYPQNFQPTPTLPTTQCTPTIFKKTHTHTHSFFYPHKFTHTHTHKLACCMCGTHTHKFIYTHNRHTSVRNKILFQKVYHMLLEFIPHACMHCMCMIIIACHHLSGPGCTIHDFFCTQNLYSARI